ncbi:MAG TPA: hypothetical protein VNY51_02155 [Candidatus Dormibacteraeota bacterium]|jgi:hypothetical protein|nr:hypothetical protein [Candidatus Dormibacteraeota bacterium]
MPTDESTARMIEEARNQSLKELDLSSRFRRPSPLEITDEM